MDHNDLYQQRMSVFCRPGRIGTKSLRHRPLRTDAGGLTVGSRGRLYRKPSSSRVRREEGLVLCRPHERRHCTQSRTEGDCSQSQLTSVNGVRQHSIMLRACWMNCQRYCRRGHTFHACQIITCRVSTSYLSSC